MLNVTSTYIVLDPLVEKFLKMFILEILVIKPLLLEVIP